MIIERPRLIKRLDASEARTILLLAPAGYGKTTLARQWTATLARAVTVTLTPAHRDVTVIARDLAESLEAAGDEGFRDFIEQYIRARPNPQSDAALIGRVLADAIGRTKIAWVIVDDYHDLADVDEAHLLVQTLLEKTDARFLVASRTRPPWATARRALYGEVDEILQRELAMNGGEATNVLATSDAAAKRMVAIAEGWPAVLGLAGHVALDKLAEADLPDAPADLHRYMAEEYLGSLSERGREVLFDLALLPGRRPDLAAATSSDQALLEVMIDYQFTMHRLIREFLLTQLLKTDPQHRRARQAIATALDDGLWLRAFDLIERFSLYDYADVVVVRSYPDLIDKGQIWTLERFTHRLPETATNVGIIAAVEAEAAYCRGNHDLMTHHAERAMQCLAEDHPLYSRVAVRVGEGMYWQANLERARRFYDIGRKTAQNDRDLTYALHRMVGLDTHYFEREPDESIRQQLAHHRHLSPENAVRLAANRLSWHRIKVGFHGADGAIDEGVRLLDGVKDPLAQTLLLHASSYAYYLRSSYREASSYCIWCDNIARTFELRLVRHQTLWLGAAILLGMRESSKCAQKLNELQALLGERPPLFHELNLTALRARHLIATGRTDAALVEVEDPRQGPCIPLMRGEYLATRALCLAVAGDCGGAVAAARAALKESGSVEARAISTVATAVALAPSGNEDSIAAAFATAEELDTFDPLVIAFRGSRSFAAACKDIAALRPTIERICFRSEDRQLARFFGVTVVRPTDMHELLTPRESEILGLLELGYRNADIGRSLYITPSTVKVHIRHIFEKLQVSTRAQAVARARELSSG